MSDATTTTTERMRQSDWRESGRGWGVRAAAWAYTFEPYARPANDLVLHQLGVGHGTRYLDVACGSGLAAAVAARRGATVSGLDASAPLIDIARARTPEADFRIGTMFELPFEDHIFDAVTSFNGIWNGCDDALREARRVLVPSGAIGLTFWGSFERMGLLPYFEAIIDSSPPSHQAATIEQGDTQQVIEKMLEATGFEITAKGAIDVANEWPDVPTAVQALASTGAATPAVEHVGYETFCATLRDIVAPWDDSHTGIRVVSELGWVTARPTEGP